MNEKNSFTSDFFFFFLATQKEIFTVAECLRCQIKLSSSKKTKKAP